MFRRFGRWLERKSSLKDPSPELLELFGAVPTAAGVAVTVESAMRCPPWFANVKVLSECQAQLPLHLYKRGEKGAKDRAIDHPVYRLLRDQPKDWTSSYEFRLNMEVALCNHGNAFAFINRTSEGRIAELIQIPSPSVNVEIDPVTMEPGYKVTDAKGREKPYDRTEIFHLHGLGTSPEVGLSPLQRAREASACRSPWNATKPLVPITDGSWAITVSRRRAPGQHWIHATFS